MKDFVQERVHLANLAHAHRSLDEYYTRTINMDCREVDNEENQKWVIRGLTASYSYERFDLKLCAEAFYFFQAEDLARTCEEIVRITSSLETLSVTEFNEQIIVLKHHWIKLMELDFKKYIQELKDSYGKKTVLPLYNSRNWHNNSCVFHATKIEYVLGALNSGKIQGYTTQRYWADGRRRKENESDYEDSYWMKGISTTRSLEFARGWGGFIFVLDLEKIKQNRPVVPYAWNYLIKDSKYPEFRTNNKKETEEFVILSKKNKRYRYSEREKFKEEYEEGIKSADPAVVEYYQKEAGKLDVHAIKEPEGFLNLNTCLKGIFITSSTLDIFGSNHPVVQEVMQHPLFIGILEK